jgi:hypothetical protein
MVNFQHPSTYLRLRSHEPKPLPNPLD